MRKHLLLVAILIFSNSGWSQETSEEDLLNFESIDKGDTPDTPSSQSQAPDPAPVPAPALPPPAAAPETAQPEVPAPLEETTQAPPPPIEEPVEKVERPPDPPPPTESFETTASSSEGELSSEDQDKEARFSRIFKQYNQSTIDDAQWASIAGEKVTETYAIQDGDTLWDLSTQFFGNGFYWPKVWQLNDDITNPHNIAVGQTLKFSPGTSVSPPKMSISEAPEQVMSQNESDSDEEVLPPMKEGEDSEKLAIPPPRRIRPVLNKFPKSIPDIFTESKGFDENGFSKEVLVKTPDKNFITPVASIISDQKWESIGEVIEMEGSTTVASTFQIILVNLKAQAKRGDFFTAYSYEGKVEDPISGGTVGYEIATRGEIQILEAVDQLPDTYRALVKNAALPINIGNDLRPGRLITRTTLASSGPPSQVAARIVNGEHGNRRVFSLHSTVYLNRGSSDGIQVGSMLNVIKNVRLRNEDAVLRFDPKPIGILKVVHAGEHVSTAVITAERDSVMPGDETSTVAAQSINIISDEPNEGGTEVSTPQQEEETSGIESVPETESPDLGNPEAEID